MTSWAGILVKRARKTIFDIANVLNTTIPPSNVRFLILHKFRTPWIFVRMLSRFLSFFIFWLYEKYTSKILIASFPKSVHFIQQTTAWTPFSTPIQVISNYVLILKNQKITWFFQKDEQWNFHLLRKSWVVYISCIKVKY